MPKAKKILENFWCLDTEYLTTQGTASYLLADGDSLLMFDCGINNSIAPLLEQIKKLGFTPQQIKALFLTHAHLDHAGGAGTLLNHLPNATVYGQKDTIRHLIEPTNLEKGVRTVYGNDFYDRVYGNLVPLEASRCQVLDDNETLSFTSKKIQAIYTPGHAWHHHAFYCPEDDVVIAGDALGLSIQRENIDQTIYLPTTPPSQFHPEEMIKSLHRIQDMQAKIVCLTHYGVVPDVNQAVDTLSDLITKTTQLIQKNHTSDNEDLCNNWTDICLQQLPNSWKKDNPNALSIIKTAVRNEAMLNISGLRYWINKQLIK